MKKPVISFIAFMLVLVVLLSACNDTKGEVETTPDVIHSEVTTPNVTTPEQTTPQQTTPEQTTPEQTTPEQPVELAPTCEHIFTRRIVLEQVTTQQDGKIANVCGTCGGWQEEILPAVKSLKILAIGNSFSDNALHYLPLLAKELGIEEVVIGRLYVGGCVIDGHWQRAQTDGAYQRFDINTGDGWVNQYPMTIQNAVTCENWDIITLQQGSAVSGDPTSYSNLQNLIDYVNANKTNPNAKLYWHMTWAYRQHSTKAAFANYNNDQLTMYNAILSTVQSEVLTKDAFAGVIPAGTAIQNYRGEFISNSVFEENYVTADNDSHLQKYAKIVVSLTWIRTLTGLSLDDVTCKSHNDLNFVTSYQLKMIREAAETAYLYPYVRTLG